MRMLTWKSTAFLSHIQPRSHDDRFLTVITFRRVSVYLQYFQITSGSCTGSVCYYTRLVTVVHSWWMSQWLMTDVDVPLSIQMELSHTEYPPPVILRLMVLNKEARMKIRQYRQIYVDRSDPIVFLPITVSTSGRVYEDFARLLFLHTHRETSILPEIYLRNRSSFVSCEFHVWLILKTL